MKIARVFGFTLCIAMFWSCVQAPAQAQTLGIYGQGGFAGPGWFGYFSDPYAAGRIPTPPYFALHPPVYYSRPVPRTYGYSPYAYPGTVSTPEVVEPEIIINPHVEEKPAIQPVKETNVKVVRAQVIHNPYALKSNARLTARP